MTKLTDQEVIRKGVELVDGWDHADGNVYLANGTFIDESTDADFDNMDQILLDALAAQLVRQVDAGPKYEIHTEADKTIVCENVWPEADRFPHHKTVDVAEGPDRTMNTLRCIVESGVLATEQGESDE